MKPNGILRALRPLPQLQTNPVNLLKFRRLADEAPEGS